jgi:thiol-disulfide isomerase/thioredoxin
VHALFALILCLGSRCGDSFEAADHDPSDDYTLYDAADAEGLGSGEFVCEGHEFNEEACLKLGCCSFDDGECWSAVGTRPCESAKEDSAGLGGESRPADVLEEVTMSIRDAQLFCNKLPRCLGFMFEGHVPKNDKQLRIFFKSESSLGKTGWTTFLHRGIEASPNVKPVYRFRGKLNSLESQPPLERELLYTGAILNLIGTTFKEVTQNLEKDVLVNIYAPWCGFCQKFKRQYGQLAENLRHVETLQIAQMDGTQNRIADFSVPAFPFLVLFPAGERKDQPLKYLGNRQPADITHWLHQHATHSAFLDEPLAVSNTQETDGILGDTGDL